MQSVQTHLPDVTLSQFVGLAHFGMTERGDRDHNEDAFGHAKDGDIVTFVVSDGAGGYAGGAAAAKLVVDQARAAALSTDPLQFKQDLGKMADAMREARRSDPVLADMAATVAELRINCHTQTAIWGHWGDSRVYWFRGEQKLAVTQDHSVVQSFVAAGLITAADALTHPKRNVLLGAVGVDGEVEPEVAGRPVYLAEGDAFLLCTDGFWNYLSDQEMLYALEFAPSVQVWVETMAALVRTSPEPDKDNFTAIGVWVTSGVDTTIQV